jgi:hypothetical protein
MALLDDYIKVVDERNKKQQFFQIAFWYMLVLLITVVTIRAIALIYFSGSWITKYLFNW